MSTLSQYEGWNLEDVVARNSHELTALHLLGARAHIVEQRASHEAEVRRLRATLEDSQRIGLAVLRARSAGRKTIRVSELVAPAEDAEWSTGDVHDADCTCGMPVGHDGDCR